MKVFFQRQATVLLIPVIAVLVVVGAAGRAHAQSEVTSVSCTLVNLEPYKIYYVLHYPVGEGTERTVGWWSLEPGEKRTVRLEFAIGVAPEVYVHAQSGDRDVVRWAWNLQDSHNGLVYFEGGDQDVVVFQSIKDEKMDLQVRAGSKTHPLEGMELAGFVLVPLSDAKHPHGLHVFSSDQFASIFDQSGLSAAKDPLALYAKRAKVLSEAFSRQAKFQRSWPNPGSDFPYYTGLALEDHNGADYPGLLVAAVDAKTTIFGDEIPFREGDVITTFGGTTVFHPAGLHTLLYAHATDREKGIQVPIAVQYVRDKQLYNVNTLFFFNEGHWKRAEDDLEKAHAFAAGIEETVGMSKTGGAAVEVGVKNVGRAIWNFIEWSAVEGDPWEDMEPVEYRNPIKEHWEIRQTHARLQQMYPDAFDAGTWVGFVTPSAPRLLFTKTLGKSMVKRGLSRTAASIATSVTLEIAEGVIWTVGTSSPLQSRDQILSDIKAVIPFSAAGGLISGSPIRRTPK